VLVSNVLTKITEIYAEIKKASPSRLKGDQIKDFLGIIKDHEQANGLEEGTISMKTIQKRYSRSCDSGCESKVIQSPLAPLDPFLVQMIIQRSMIRRPWKNQN